MRRVGALRRLTLADRAPWKVRPRPSAASLDRIWRDFYGEAQLLAALERQRHDAQLPTGREFIFPIRLDP